MDRLGLAVSRFKQGFHCSQSLFSTYSPNFGLNLQTDPRIGAPF